MIRYPSGLFGFFILFRLHGSAAFKAITPSLVSCIIFFLLNAYTELAIGNREPGQDPVFGHPYPITALVSALTFLLSFRANFSYNRYWEAQTAVHHMHSKWLDVGMELAAFHLQAVQYGHVRPPAFGEHPDLTCLERERERFNVTTLQELQQQLQQNDQLEQQQQQQQLEQKNSKKWGGVQYWKIMSWKRNRRRGLQQSAGNSRGSSKNKSSKKDGSNSRSKPTEPTEKVDGLTTKKSAPKPPPPPPKQYSHSRKYKSINRPYDPAFVPGSRGIRRHHHHHPHRGKRQRELGARIPFPPFSRHPAAPSIPPTKAAVKTVKPLSTTTAAQASSRVTTSGGKNSANNNNNNNNSSSSSLLVMIPQHAGPAQNTHAAWDPELPPLFLQEGAHLLSLLSAVAMSTLRNDLEQADSPLIAFRAGAPWPHVDPDDYGATVRQDWDATRHRSWAVLRYVLGVSRSPYSRTLYNAARPFRVMGGVSDAEIQLLQAARGPLAKVALCTMWLQEYMSREYLAGSMGKVAPPILSRLYQYVSDGMLGYTQARKIAYIPFPFPHAQITSLFVLIVVAVMPVLMLSYIQNVTFAFCMNFLTVMCFSGLHEVARELESPFQNAPNDVPLNYFQAQFNEALLTMFAGYHPDSYWEVCETVQQPQEEEEEEEPKAAAAAAAPAAAATLKKKDEQPPKPLALAGPDESNDTGSGNDVPDDLGGNDDDDDDGDDFKVVSSFGASKPSSLDQFESAV